MNMNINYSLKNLNLIIKFKNLEKNVKIIDLNHLYFQKKIKVYNNKLIEILHIFHLQKKKHKI